MKTSFSCLAVLLTVGSAAVYAQTVEVPAPAVPAPAAESTTTVKRVTVIPAPVAVPRSATEPLAPVTSKTTTTTTATTTGPATTVGAIASNGVLDVYEPGARFVLRESTGPVTYTYSPQTVYSTPSGVVLTGEQVRTRVKAGLPVRVEYHNEGPSRVIQRVVVEDRYLKDD